MRHLADKMAHKSHSEVLGHMRARIFLLSFELQICAFGAVELNGEGWRLKMELSFHTCQNKFQHCFSCLFCNMFYVFKSSSLCVRIFATCINYVFIL